MNRSQQVVLGAGLAAGVALIAFRRRFDKQLAYEAPGHYNIPFTGIGICDVKVETSMFGICLQSLATLTGLSLYLLRDSDDD
jgi:hypothetical protein